MHDAAAVRIAFDGLAKRHEQAFDFPKVGEDVDAMCGSKLAPDRVFYQLQHMAFAFDPKNVLVKFRLRLKALPGGEYKVEGLAFPFLFPGIGQHGNLLHPMRHLNEILVGR